MWRYFILLLCEVKFDVPFVSSRFILFLFDLEVFHGFSSCSSCFFPSGVPSDLHRYSLAFSADGRWLFSMAAEERKGSKGSSGRSNELTATTSPLCAWRLDDAKLKAGLQPRASHLRLAMKEKVRLVPHPEEGIPWECGACLLETSIGNDWKPVGQMFEVLTNTVAVYCSKLNECLLLFQPFATPVSN
jgi:hypothetical protein